MLTVPCASSSTRDALSSPYAELKCVQASERLSKYAQMRIRSKFSVSGCVKTGTHTETHFCLSGVRDNSPLLLLTTMHSVTSAVITQQAHELSPSRRKTLHVERKPARVALVWSLVPYLKISPSSRVTQQWEDETREVSM